MTFDEAKQVRLPFGKFSGMTIDEAARTDSGLSYLDWLRGVDIKSLSLREAINVYLDEPSIAQEVEDLDSDFTNLQED